MARVKLSEYRAKSLLLPVLGGSYDGVTVDLGEDYAETIKRLSAKGLYVCKVDQAVKRRNQSGLVRLRCNRQQVLEALRNFAAQGFRYALVEPYVPHNRDDERYLALVRQDDGIQLSYSSKGGNDIEANAASLRHTLLGAEKFTMSPPIAGLNRQLVEKLYDVFQSAHMTMLEINPYLIVDGRMLPLDAAVQVDSAAEFFADGAWNETDIRQAQTTITPQQQRVEDLNARSPASLSLKVLNPDGAYFLLLSGGGASVVVADELAHTGRFEDIANYGEYSGNPSEAETYIYATAVLELLMASKAKRKVLVIAGGVANFTDVAKTFAGIIRALRDNAQALKRQKVVVVVRCGGPNQAGGLAAMTACLEELGLAHSVDGPDVSLAQTVARAVEYRK